MHTLRLRSIHDQILASLHQTSRSAILDEFLRHGARILVLGGAVRDAIAFDYDNQSEWTPRDFDIGVSGIKPQEFEYVLSAFGNRNRHGGFVVREQGLPMWDLWRLENSIGLRRTGAPFSLENVLRSFNLDCNAIALDLRTGIITDAGAIEAVRRKRVGFVSNAIRHSFRTFAAKALLTQIRFGYSSSAGIKDLVETNLHSDVLVYESKKVFPQLSLISATTAQVRSRSGFQYLLSV